MKNVRIFFLILCFCLLSFSCGDGLDMETWTATVTIHNNSDYDVTDIWISGINKVVVPNLGKSSEQTLSLEWEDHKNNTGEPIKIDYKANGEEFTVEQQKNDAVLYKFIPVGNYEWEEDGVKFSLYNIDEPNDDVDSGIYISLLHFVKNDSVEIFIENDGYTIEGGKFKKKVINFPIPPQFREYYPEEYFEYDY